MLLLGSSAAILGGYSVYSTNLNNASRFEDVSAAPLFVGGLISTVLWLYGVIDSGNAVDRYNLEHGFMKRVSVHPDIGTDYAGLSLSFHF